jgi:hypothetical protein
VRGWRIAGFAHHGRGRAATRTGRSGALAGYVVLAGRRLGLPQAEPVAELAHVPP